MDGAENNIGELLQDACTPKLYRENPFRLAWLRADSSNREIARHADKLKMQIELGHAEAIPEQSLFTLDPAPGPEEIREAVNQLKDPQSRIIHEFFWFWPLKIGEGESDEALVALEEGEDEAALVLWRKWESERGERGAIGGHNMAVYYHMLALDLSAEDLFCWERDEELDPPPAKNNGGNLSGEETWAAILDHLASHKPIAAEYAQKAVFAEDDGEYFTVAIAPEETIAKESLMRDRTRMPIEELLNSMNNSACKLKIELRDGVKPVIIPAEMAEEDEPQTEPEERIRYNWRQAFKRWMMSTTPLTRCFVPRGGMSSSYSRQRSPSALRGLGKFLLPSETF